MKTTATANAAVSTIITGAHEVSASETGSTVTVTQYRRASVGRGMDETGKVTGKLVAIGDMVRRPGCSFAWVEVTLDTAASTTKTVINPSARLLRAAGNPPVRYVRTCLSSTCSCFSHDSGYDTAEIPADLPTFTHGGSVHSHHQTELLDERGTLVQDLSTAAWRAKLDSPGSNGSRAGAREYAESCRALDTARTALELFDQGFGPADKCRVEASRLANQVDRVARKARRAEALKAMTDAGIPAYAAQALYGAGRWSNELSPSQWIALADLGHETLSRAANARSNRELDAIGLPVAGSHPRRTAWAAYAAKAFYGSVLDIPARGTWRDIARRKGVTVR